jgi:hypothetical protein
VVSFEPIVLHELMHRPSQVRLAQWDDPIEALAPVHLGKVDVLPPRIARSVETEPRA